MSPRWITLCRLDELTEGSGKYVELPAHRLAVFLHQGKPFVTANACPHAGGAMSGGYVTEQGCAVCPWHGWAFDLTSGKLQGGWDDSEMLATYPCRVRTEETGPNQGVTWVQAELKMP
jgi:nitrite reductase/ring-hydroxylating ferredoxin subunit